MRLRISKGGIARMRTVAAPVARALPLGATEFRPDHPREDQTARGGRLTPAAALHSGDGVASRGVAWSASIAHKAITPGFTPDETIDIGVD